MKRMNKLFKTLCVALCCILIVPAVACAKSGDSTSGGETTSDSGKEQVKMEWEMGYSAKNLEFSKSEIKGGALRVDMSKNEGQLYIGTESIQEFSGGDLLAVSLNVYPVKVKKEKFSTLNLAYENGEIFDCAFAVEEWSMANYEAKVQTDGETKYITLGFDWLRNLTAHVEILSVEKSTLPEVLFDGDKLTLLRAKNVQMEGFTYETDGKLVVMDGGNTVDAKHLYEKITEISPDKKVDMWLISHYHCDHVDALIEILNNETYDIEIAELYYDFPTKEQLGNQGDEDNHCIDDLNNAVKNHPEKVKKVITPKKGDSYKIGNIEVKVLNNACFDAGSNYSNDSSICFKFVTKGESILFLGDLGLKGDDYLKDKDFVKEIETCSVVQTAHHGQNGVSDEFYRKCKAMKVCLYCAPYWLYNVDSGAGYGSGTWNTLKTRRLMAQLGVLRNYSSASGEDEIIL